jgi:hypothetical protein
MTASSRLALASIDQTALEALVLDTIASFGAAGCISDEVRQAHPDLAYSSTTARYSKLLSKGLIIDTGRRRPGLSGRGQRVVVAASQIRG